MEKVTVKAEPVWPADEGMVPDLDHENMLINPLKLEPELIITPGVKAEPHSDEDAEDPLAVAAALNVNTWDSSNITTTKMTNSSENNTTTVLQLGHVPTPERKGSLRSHSEFPDKCSTNAQADHNNRFTQTENTSATYNGPFLEGESATVWKNDMDSTVDPSGMQQYRTNSHIYDTNNTLRSKCLEENSNGRTSEISLNCNTNLMQRVCVEQVPSGVVANGMGSNEGCFHLEVSQPFGYGCSVVGHMSMTSPEVFKCELCDLVFTHLSLLNHHKSIHNTSNEPQNHRNKKSPHKCDVCGFTFNLIEELRSHKRAMHKTITKIRIQQHAKAKCCDSCGVELSKYVKCECCIDSGGRNNAGSNSEQEGQENGSTIGITKCLKCSGSTNSNDTHNNEKVFHCDVCNAEFSHYSGLWSHKKLHSGERPYKCETCGLAFAKATYLKNHSRVHTGEKPYKCSVCGMQFSQSPHLKNHERIHSGEKPYHCEFCSKTFARHSTLWNHRRIHTGEKPYRCDLCGTAFNQATHLKNHFRVHSGERPHHCDICDASFADKSALKRHRSIHGKYNNTSASNKEESKK